MISEIPEFSDRAAPPGSGAIADAVPRLALRALGRSFGAEVAVDDLNLEIAKGEFISLLGPSGCGKSTTLRMIAGFIQPSAGVIEKDQVIIASAKRALPPEKRDMVMIFQSYALWPHKTVAENVAFGLRLRKVDNAAIRRRVTEMLQAVKLDSLAGRYPAEEEMRVEIRRLHNKFNMTTILVTHDQAEAMATSDRIAIMNKGKLEQVDTPLALYAWPKTRFVANFIGRTNFLEARCDHTDVVFDGFSIARERFGPRGLEFSGHVTFSLRPQNIGIARRQAVGGMPHDETLMRMPATILEAAFFGEYWEYVVALAAGDQRLRVVCRPNETFDVGQEVLLSVDPRQMAPVA